MNTQIGTLIRCRDITEKRLGFYQKIGLNILQLAGVDEDYLAPGKEAKQKSENLFALFLRYAFSVPCMFLSYPNQDWTHPKETAGLVPEKFRSERMLLSCRQMQWGKQYGIKYISCHVGFLPEKGTESYDTFVSEMRQLVMFAESNGQQFLFETGMESTQEMKQILSDLMPAHPGINFDPANLLIYDQEDPASFLDELENKVEVVHCKDARRPAPGAAFGRETILGEGDTGFAELLKRLLRNGFSGFLVIERELPPGEEQERDISNAVHFIQTICKGAENA